MRGKLGHVLQQSCLVTGNIKQGTLGKKHIRDDLPLTCVRKTFLTSKWNNHSTAWPHSSWQLIESTKKHSSKEPGHVAKVQPFSSFLQDHTSSLRPRLCWVLWKSCGRKAGSAPWTLCDVAVGLAPSRGNVDMGQLLPCYWKKGLQIGRKKEEMHQGLFTLQLSFCCIFRLDLLLFSHFSQFWSVLTLHFLLFSKNCTEKHRGFLILNSAENIGSCPICCFPCPAPSFSVFMGQQFHWPF